MTHSFVQKSPKPSHSIQKKKKSGPLNGSPGSIHSGPLLQLWSICHQLQLQQSCSFSSNTPGLSFFRGLTCSLPKMLFFWIFTRWSPCRFGSLLKCHLLSWSLLWYSTKKKKKCNTHTLSPSPLSLHFTLNTYYHLINCLFYVSCLYFLSLHDRKWSPVGEVIAFCLDQLSSALKKHLAYDKSSGFVK